MGLIANDAKGASLQVDGLAGRAELDRPPPLARHAPRIGNRVREALTVILPGFLVELGLFLAALELLQVSGYGNQQVRTHNFPLGLLFAAGAWAIAEGHFRLYRRVWRVAGFPDALAIAGAVIEATVLIGIANAVMPDSIRPYRYLVPPLAAPTAVAMICVYRLWPRLWAVARRGGKRLLVVAPDSGTFPLIRWMILNAPSGWEPVAILTMSAEDHGKTVHGVPVTGPVDEIARWSEVVRADGVAFIPAGALATTWKELVGQCLAAELPIFVLPGPEKALQARETQLRSLTADDLVGRAPRGIDLDSARAHIQGRTVMVTGAAGSIGAELCRLLATLEPRRLILVDNNESGLFEIGQELRGTAAAPEIREALVSIEDLKSLRALFARDQPATVFHAAAYKHVPLLEAHPLQAVRTNVLGTHHALTCAAAAGTATFILISTDKAVARHSIMGCSKRLCEMLVLDFEGGTSCWAVRFGNVVGSRGSVVPTFERQIQCGGPVTITDPLATRYLMTVREAASLVISTLSLGRRGHLYMLDMGEPISIESLARSLIRSRGLRPGTDIELMFTGLRPGESLTEALLAPEETSRQTDNSSILEVLSPRPRSHADLNEILRRIRILLEEDRGEELVALLRWAVTADPGSRPIPGSQESEGASALPAPS
jgi:FlaA1/EpsC-like NDP-sugar epimerase